MTAFILVQDKIQAFRLIRGKKPTFLPYLKQDNGLHPDQDGGVQPTPRQDCGLQLFTTKQVEVGPTRRQFNLLSWFCCSYSLTKTKTLPQHYGFQSFNHRPKIQT